MVNRNKTKQQYKKTTAASWLSFVCGICLLFGASSCGKSYFYEENIDIPKAQWQRDSLISFDFEIQNTAQSYDFYYQIRNSVSYDFCNLYVIYELQDSTGKVLLRKVQENELMDCKTGKPYGSGLGDFYEHDFLLFKNYTFDKNGRYFLRLQQYMRQEALSHIAAVGLRIETPQKAE